MLGTVPGTWETSLNKINKNLCLCGIDILVGRQTINHTQSLYVNYSMLGVIREGGIQQQGKGGWTVQGGGDCVINGVVSLMREAAFQEGLEGGKMILN